MSIWSRWRTKHEERKQAQAEALKSLHDEPSSANQQAAQNKIDKWSGGT
jgi:hypothetical protein